VGGADHDVTLTAAEWLLLGVGLGGLAATVTALVWRVFGTRRATSRAKNAGTDRESTAPIDTDYP
jgi:hypothetical protein